MIPAPFLRHLCRSLVIVCVAFSASAVYAEGDAARGEARAAACAACHGPGGNSRSPTMFPTIAGMEAERMIELLHAYRSGEKANPMMSPQASTLSDQDILDLAAYFSEQ